MTQPPDTFSGRKLGFEKYTLLRKGCANDRIRIGKFEREWEQKLRLSVHLTNDESLNRNQKRVRYHLTL